ncbi:hypothetical protein [Lyngbya confervoides]|uniref:Uncharacterized protein n=1 Tax=Lyngbya confervoides BDU141951 TaxID=1574623 RepID=A0ABD4T0R1_9CYAN|nr:hypothetical protein [Lyngbya confervoides]MCM1981940.1 hypothetical protein [Lyngbya confervoides BDU141951]
MNLSSSTKGSSLIVLLMSFGLLSNPTIAAVNAEEILQPEAETSSQSVPPATKDLIKADMAYIKAMKLRLERD